MGQQWVWCGRELNGKLHFAMTTVMIPFTDRGIYFILGFQGKALIG